MGIFGKYGLIPNSKPICDCERVRVVVPVSSPGSALRQRRYKEERPPKGESRLSRKRSRCENLPAFLDGVGRVSFEVAQGILLAAGPGDLDAIHLGFSSQAESQGEFALRAVTRAGMNRLPVHAAARAHAHIRADAVTIGASAHRPNPDGVIQASAFILEQVGRTAVIGEQNIWRAVVIDVGVGSTARDHLTNEAELLPCFLKSVVSH